MCDIDGMKQMNLDESGFERETKRTRKHEFLDEMNLVVPWVQLVSLIAPHGPAHGTKGGRPPFAVENMLRIHFLQQWFNLSDPAMGALLYDMALPRKFVGLDAGGDNLPDESTILRFRHLLETHNLNLQILATVTATLAANGLLLNSGTAIDAALIAATSSTKNSSDERGPKMHCTKKGNQCHFGTKAHIGVDADSGLVHTVAGRAASVNDVMQAHALVHGEETNVLADTGYQDVDKREETQGINHWHVATQPDKRKGLEKSTTRGAILDQLEPVKARLQAKVEHPLRLIKNQFRHVKVLYQGLKKNTAQLHTLFPLSNLWMVGMTLRQEMRG
jgi:IS5 family transposase